MIKLVFHPYGTDKKEYRCEALDFGAFESLDQARAFACSLVRHSQHKESAIATVTHQGEDVKTFFVWKVRRGVVCEKAERKPL